MALQAGFFPFMLAVPECSRRKQPENPDRTVFSLGISALREPVFGLGLLSGMPVPSQALRGALADQNGSSCGSQGH